MPGKTERMNNERKTKITICFCVPEDQEFFLPKRRRAPGHLPPEAPLPRTGEYVYLSSSSAWQVMSVIHEWRSEVDLHIECWLEYVGSARHRRPAAFALTQ